MEWSVGFALRRPPRAWLSERDPVSANWQAIRQTGAQPEPPLLHWLTILRVPLEGPSHSGSGDVDDTCPPESRPEYDDSRWFCGEH